MMHQVILVRNSKKSITSNFNKTAAKTTEPAVGASVCAL